MSLKPYIFFILIAFSLPAFASAPDEKEKIHYLLDEVSQARNAVFLRNGSAYSPAQAREHLEYKLQHSGIAIDNADDFITHIASASSFSGEPYYIQFSNGRKEKTADWMRERLSHIKRAGHAH